MTDADLQLIIQTIEKTVNGKIDTLSNKIDCHNEKHEADMKTVLPIIEAYEQAQKVIENTQKTGAFMVKVGTGVAAIGGAYLTLKTLFGW